MKTKKLMVLCGLVVSLFTLTSFTKVAQSVVFSEHNLAQKGFVVYATYDGKEDYGYNFKTLGRHGNEHAITFQKVNESVLKAFNLNSDDFVGTKFKITFNKDVNVTKDDNGVENEEEINTITDLEKL